MVHDLTQIENFGTYFTLLMSCTKSCIYTKNLKAEDKSIHGRSLKKIGTPSKQNVLII